MKNLTLYFFVVMLLIKSLFAESNFKVIEETVQISDDNEKEYTHYPFKIKFHSEKYSNIVSINDRTGYTTVVFSHYKKERRLLVSDYFPLPFDDKNINNESYFLKCLQSDSICKETTSNVINFTFKNQTGQLKKYYIGNIVAYVSFPEIPKNAASAIFFKDDELIGYMQYGKLFSRSKINFNDFKKIIFSVKTNIQKYDENDLFQDGKNNFLEDELDLALDNFVSVLILNNDNNEAKKGVSLIFQRKAQKYINSSIEILK